MLGFKGITLILNKMQLRFYKMVSYHRFLNSNIQDQCYNIEKVMRMSYIGCDV